MAFLSLFLTACDNSPLNNPHENTTQTEKILYTSFAEQPKTLDPAKSYSQNEYAFIAQIYEPVLQYHYLKRPYELVPLTANQMPTTRYYNANDEEVKENSKNIAYTIFDIQIQQNILYQPHPAFASKPEKGSQLHDSINDFKQLGTRELTAEDYVYQIKRLADPRNNSPIFGVMAEHIAGFGALREEIAAAIEKNKQLKRIRFVDLRKIDFEGARVTGRYRYEIKINNKYPQFLYWLAMPFFAPIPWEAEKFYSQPGMKDRNLSLKWYPVGTGPYLLHDNDPNRRMLLQRNPNFRGELYPSGDVDDRKMPTIDKVVFSLEKESIPRWNKFLQGYYDTSGIGSDSFDQAIEFSDDGQARLTEFMKSKDIQLRTSVAASVFYLGFNMLDDVVGGDSERARKLRQAISIAINYEEFIQIFLNGRGVSAQGPIPPGIFGHAVGKEEINPYVFDWENNKPKRKSIEYAQQLMREAGYEKGRDIQTGEQLVLNYDIPAAGGPDDKARFNWMRKQFAKLGIDLNIRATQYNRFQEKIRTGNAQIFFWGWGADYPDPENFLFLLYGPNGKVAHGGENASNYLNAEYDGLFLKMRDMANTAEREALIEKMLEIVRRDAPVIWGFHPKNFTLSHAWMRAGLPNEMANNTLKYLDINPFERAKNQKAWNRPNIAPIVIIGLIILAIALPAFLQYRRKSHKTPGRI